MTVPMIMGLSLVPVIVAGMICIFRPESEVAVSMGLAPVVVAVAQDEEHDQIGSYSEHGGAKHHPDIQLCVAVDESLDGLLDQNNGQNPNDDD
eukprot:CAMPEP_0116965262 /NCGR_PEP_ID=MMETSP0467-20121206/49107_1 /TAXON_ID=283647 /ORGANISM="Mesodinium pulex, Strain SPMC105" /LENGTH=92 /DNA_ID=CAMNT_0004654459 /DNA_START=867 /DNA_END=1145 /DNA_ORIENTATION=-